MATAAMTQTLREILTATLFGSVLSHPRPGSDTHEHDRGGRAEARPLHAELRSAYDTPSFARPTTRRASLGLRHADLRSAYDTPSFARPTTLGPWRERGRDR